MAALRERDCELDEVLAGGEPLLNEGIHLPPSAHGTFRAPGVAICTFMPWPLETDPKAARLPWYHRNIDVDEVLFVHSGSFSFSGRPTGRGAGVLTLNPQGLQHGPKRADLELAQKEWRRGTRDWKDARSTSIASEHWRSRLKRMRLKQSTLSDTPAVPEAMRFPRPRRTPSSFSSA